MPVLQPQAQPDKAMTLDIEAIMSANAAQAAPTPTTIYAAPAQGPATTAAAAPVSEDTDFAEPQNPWAVPEPAPAPVQTQFAAPSQQQSAAPAAPPAGPPSQLAGPPQNPWAAMYSQKATPQQSAAPPQGQNPWAALQSQQAPKSSAPPAAETRQAVYPPVPPEISQSIPAAEPTTVKAASSAPAAPAAESSAPVQRQCFTNGEGVKICYMSDEQHHNTTDVHKEGGVNDYHNQNSDSGKEAIQGHIPGNNVTNTLNHLGENPPPNSHKDGNTAFQGKGDAEINHSHDIHKDNSTFTDHESNSGNLDADWKSAYKGPDGSKEMAEINQGEQFKDDSDTRVDEQGKDTVDVEEWKGSDDHKFMADHPGEKDDSTLVWDEDESGKSQKEEFQGQGVYDLHEESDSSKKVKAKVDGDQGWEAFGQDMKDFDNFFDGDDAWKVRMKDPRVATAASASGVAMPTASSSSGMSAVVAKRGAPRHYLTGFARCMAYGDCDFNDPYEYHERRDVAGARSVDEASPVDVAILEESKKLLGLQERDQPWWKQDWENWKDGHDAAMQEQEKEKAKEREEKSHHHDGRDVLALTAQGENDFYLTQALTPRAGGFSSIGAAVNANNDARVANTNDRNQALGIIVIVAFLFILGTFLGCVLGRRVGRCLQRRRERKARQVYDRDFEGCHVVDPNSASSSVSGSKEAIQ